MQSLTTQSQELKRDLELLRAKRSRRQIRTSFTEFARYKGFEPAPHHALIIREIEQFLVGDDDILLLAAPPGSAKSHYVSVLLPSWYLANHPQNSILAATHSMEFAERWGRRVRNDIVLDANILGLQLADDSQAATRWALKSGGEYYGVGAGVGISGFRADLGLGDDFFGSREDAYSATVRNKRWEWYVNDFSARLKPDAKRILISTRWHEDDVTGRILLQRDAGQVRVREVSIPAIAEHGDPVGRKPGEYLWDEPQGYNYGEFLRARQRETSPMMWAALYQQRPAPEEGDYFKAAWLKTYDSLPDLKTLSVYGGSDYAVTADGGDYTVHLVVGIDPDGKMYVLDIWRRQTTPDVWIDSFCDLVKQWHPIEWAEEKGQIRGSVGPFLESRQIERQAYVVRTGFAAKHNKAIMAQSIRARMALQSLYLPKDATWLEPFMSELMSFPASGKDDQVDALAKIGMLLDTIMPGQAPEKPKPKEDQSGYHSAEDYDDVNMVLTL